MNFIVYNHADVQGTSIRMPPRTPTATATPLAISVTGGHPVYLPLIMTNP